jgi:hypothetical protein
MKIIYENDRGERTEIMDSFPYFLQDFIGADGTNTEITKTKGVGQDGSTINNVSLSDRNLQILGVIKGQSKAEIERYRAKLLQVFNPKIRGWLQYEYGDVKRRIRCQVENAPKFTKKFTGYKYQDFLINLICPNPFWQDLSQSKAEIAIWRGAFEFPLEILEEGIELGYREPSLIVNVLNKGDVATGMRIQFKALATVENPSLFNVNTREYFKINKIMEAGEVITVNTHFQNKKVELNKNGVISNAFNWIDFQSTFLQLDPGDNLFRYDADEGLGNLEVSIYFNPQYLGV